jgi:hypothetical protein
MRDANRAQLTAVARQVKPLLGELVFVGGCATGLLLTDPASPSPRPTLDVDAIAGVRDYSEYMTFSARLRNLGFAEDVRQGSPVCRWISDRLIFDVMPCDEKVLGFSSRWYDEALRTSREVELEPGLQIRIISAPVFLATKLEAFRGRGHEDYLGSHDLEDALAVIDGRGCLLDEVRRCAGELRKFLAKEIAALLRDQRFLDALPGHLPPDFSSQARLVILMERLQTIAALG